MKAFIDDWSIISAAINGTDAGAATAIRIVSATLAARVVASTTLRTACAQPTKQASHYRWQSIAHDW